MQAFTMIESNTTNDADEVTSKMVTSPASCEQQQKEYKIPLLYVLLQSWKFLPINYTKNTLYVKWN